MYGTSRRCTYMFKKLSAPLKKENHRRSSDFRKKQMCTGICLCIAVRPRGEGSRRRGVPGKRMRRNMSFDKLCSYLHFYYSTAILYMQCEIVRSTVVLSPIVSDMTVQAGSRPGIGIFPAFVSLHKYHADIL